MKNFEHSFIDVQRGGREEEGRGEGKSVRATHHHMRKRYALQTE